MGIVIGESDSVDGLWPRLEASFKSSEDAQCVYMIKQSQDNLKKDLEKQKSKALEIQSQLTSEINNINRSTSQFLEVNYAKKIESLNEKENELQQVIHRQEEFIRDLEIQMAELKEDIFEIMDSLKTFEQSKDVQYYVNLVKLYQNSSGVIFDTNSKCISGNVLNTRSSLSFSFDSEKSASEIAEEIWNLIES